MAWNDVFTKLEETFASLVETREECKLIANEAGLNTANINFAGNARTFWGDLLLEAYKQGKVWQVIQAVGRRYQDNPEFQSACQAYQAWAEEEKQQKNKPPRKAAKPGANNGKRRKKPAPASEAVASVGASSPESISAGKDVKPPSTAGGEPKPAGAPEQKQKEEATARGFTRWWNSLPSAMQVAMIGLLVPVIAGCFALFNAFVSPWAEHLFNPPLASVSTATPTPTSTLKPSLTPTPTLEVTPTASPTPGSTPTSTPPACAYGELAGQAALEWLARAEADASTAKDLALIGRIFAKDAWIWDAAKNMHWTDPQVRYGKFFSEVETIQSSHADFQLAGPGIGPQRAWLTTSSVTTIDGANTYTNPPLSEHWTFTKNAAGCWQIESLVFNASHLSFPCACQGLSDDDTFRCLIKAEGEAVQKKDLLAIWSIYAPGASIFDGDQSRSSDPLEYYQKQLFDLLDFANPRHFDIRPVRVEAQQAMYTSGSEGSYGPPGGQKTTYNNPNPSEHWTFGKNADGCWVIDRFAFNASHIAFP